MHVHNEHVVLEFFAFWRIPSSSPERLVRILLVGQTSSILFGRRTYARNILTAYSQLLSCLPCPISCRSVLIPSNQTCRRGSPSRARRSPQIYTYFIDWTADETHERSIPGTLAHFCPLWVLPTYCSRSTQTNACWSFFVHTRQRRSSKS